MAVGGGGEGRDASGAVATAVERGRREVKAWIGLRFLRARFSSWRIVMVAASAALPVVEFLHCDD